MFRVTQSPTFWSKVEFEWIPEDGTKARKFEYEQQFPRMSQEELKAFGQWIDRGITDDIEIARVLLNGEWKKTLHPNDEEIQKAEPVLMKWKGICDEQDVPLVPSKGTIDMLLANVGLGSVIAKVFMRDISRAGSKNF